MMRRFDPECWRRSADQMHWDWRIGRTVEPLVRPNTRSITSPKAFTARSSSIQQQDILANDQQQQQRVNSPSEQQQQHLKLRLRPPGRQYAQLWKQRRPRRQRRLLDAPLDPRDPLYGTTKRERKAALQQQLQEAYGPHAGDRDVRLYLKRRALNAARPRPSRRGGFPLDDSFDKPGTFLKLSIDFQRTVLLERVQELVSTLRRLQPAAAWRLYTTLPGLLVFSTLEVAQRLTGLSNATGLGLEATLEYCCSCRPFAFLAPDSVLSRVALLAKVAGLQRGPAVLLMQQHPSLWLMSSRRLAPRIEQLSLLLCCCRVTALRLIGSCPRLLTAPWVQLQQQLWDLCSLLGVAGQPSRVVPLLLWRPSLLLSKLRQEPAPLQPHDAVDQQQREQQQQRQRQQQERQRPADVAQQLQGLSRGLGLPTSCVQELVLRAPDQLQLAAAGPRAVAAAVSALSSSWLLAPEAAVQDRQQYQQQLLQLLQPQLHSKGLRKRRVKQGQPGSGWYDAAQASEDAGLQYQWWRQQPQQQPQQQQQQQQQAWAQQQQQNLTALQQLVLQAPALLALVGKQGAGSPQDSGTPVPTTTTTTASQPAAQAAGLDARLQLLCEQLLPLLDDAPAAVIQGIRPLEQQQGGQQQHQHAPGSSIQPAQLPAGAGDQQQQLTAALKQAAVAEPCLLVQSPDWVVVQLHKLSAALQVPVASMVLLFLQCPALLWLTQAQVFEQVRVLCGVLMLPAPQVKQMVATPAAAPLLLAHQEGIKRGFIAATAAGGHVGQMRQTILQRPELLLPGNLRGLSTVAG